MSKKDYGCFALCFGGCCKKEKKEKKEKIRNAGSVKRVVQRVSDDKGTQTQEVLSRKSAPANFAGCYRSGIAVRDGNGFSVQRVRGRADEDKGKYVRVLSPLSEVKGDEVNENQLVSSKSISRLISSISPQPARDLFQSPFKLDKTSTRPRLIPITPDLLLKKTPRLSFPVKPPTRDSNPLPS